MKPTRRKMFAGLALAAGIGLIYFETVHRPDTSSGESAFWLVIAALLILFALVELFSRPTDPP